MAHLRMDLFGHRQIEMQGLTQQGLRALGQRRGQSLSQRIKHRRTHSRLLAGSAGPATPYLHTAKHPSPNRSYRQQLRPLYQHLLPLHVPMGYFSGKFCLRTVTQQPLGLVSSRLDLAEPQSPASNMSQNLTSEAVLTLTLNKNRLLQQTGTGPRLLTNNLQGNMLLQSLKQVIPGPTATLLGQN